MEERPHFQAGAVETPTAVPAAQWGQVLEIILGPVEGAGKRREAGIRRLKQRDPERSVQVSQRLNRPPGRPPRRTLYTLLVAEVSSFDDVVADRDDDCLGYACHHRCLPSHYFLCCHPQ